MARRIGFNDKERGRPADPHPSPARADNAGEGVGEPAHAPDLYVGPRRASMLQAGRKNPIVWVIIAFLSFWLFGWTMGILIMAVTLLSGGMEGAGIFPLIWLGFATVAWAVAVRALFWLIRGVRTPRNQGEKRGA